MSVKILDAAGILGQQLSLSLENLQLFDQTIRAERELGGVIDALGDLVVVCDAEWRVVRGTRAFAARIGLPPSNLPGSELRDLVGEALTGTVSEALAAALRPRNAPFESRERFWDSPSPSTPAT